MAKDDRGHYITTFTGRRFNFLNPRPEEVAVEDVAHALSQACRFNGMSATFYSVAEHSVLVSRIAPPDLALEGLLHDAHGAYVGDVVAPLKRAMRVRAGDRPTPWDAVEAQARGAVAQAFGLKREVPTAVKAADERALAREKAVFYDGAEPGGAEAPGLRLLSPLEAEREFLERFEELTGEEVAKIGLGRPLLSTVDCRCREGTDGGDCGSEG